MNDTLNKLTQSTSNGLVKMRVSACNYPSANDLIFSFLCEHIAGESTQSSEARSIDYFLRDPLPENTHLHHAIRVRDFFHQSEQFCMDVLPLLLPTKFGKATPTEELNGIGSFVLAGKEISLWQEGAHVPLRSIR